MNVDPLMIDINTAIPLGLIVNELLTNALKHGFPGDRKGIITVDFYKEDDTIELVVSDDGVGFPEDLDFKNTKSLGLQLVNSLTGQIDGEINLKVDGGTKFTLRFKEEF